MKNVIGLDIGGTKITGILFDGKSQLKELSIVTPKNFFEFRRNLGKLIAFLSSGEKVQGIGAGIAGLVNSKGVIEISPNIKFIKKLNFEKALGEITGLKSKVDNDASCFGRAELELGQGKKFKHFIAATLGTGIGGAVIANGKLYRGSENLGAEFGHLVSDGKFLEEGFQKARDSKDNKRLAEILGQSFAGLFNVFAPEALILGGGVATDKRRDFLTPMKKEISKFLFSEQIKPQILISKLKNAGALGAALLIK